MVQLSTCFSLENASTSHDAARLKQELDALAGVTSVSISSSGRLAVDYDSTGIRYSEILQKISSLGYRLRENQ